MKDKAGILIAGITGLVTLLTSLITAGEVKYVMIIISILSVIGLIYFIISKAKNNNDKYHKIKSEEIISVDIENINMKEYFKEIDEDYHFESHRYFISMFEWIGQLLYLQTCNNLKRLYIVVIFLFQKYYTFYLRPIQFIRDNIDVIKNDNEQFIKDKDVLIRPISLWIDEYNQKSISIDIPEKFIELFHKYHQNSINDVKEEIHRIVEDNRFDREKINALLSSLYKGMRKTQEDIDKILELNGELDSILEGISEKDLKKQYEKILIEIRHFRESSNEKLLKEINLKDTLKD